jgi:hypothetical protein
MACDFIALHEVFKGKFKPIGATYNDGDARAIAKENGGVVMEADYGDRPMFFVFEHAEAVRLKTYTDDHWIGCKLTFAEEL